MLACSLFIIAGLILLVVWERARGTRQLREIVGRLQSARVELEPEKYFAQTVPKNDNAAIDFLSISDDLKSFQLPDDLPPVPAMRMAVPGQAISFVKADGWPTATGEVLPWERLREVQAEALRWHTNLQAIASRPRFASPLDFSKGTADMELKSLAGLPAAARALRTTALVDLHDSNDLRSAQSVITLLNLFCNKSEDSILISEMVRWNYARSASTLTWELLQHAHVPDEVWAALQLAWERCRFLSGYERVRRAELAIAVDYFTRLKGAASYRRHILDNFTKMEEMMPGSWNPPVRGFFLYRVHAPLWRLLWADQDFASSLRAHETEFRLAQLAQSSSWTKVQEEAARQGRTNEIALYPTFGGLEKKSIYDRFRYLYSTPPSIFDGSQILRAFQAETEARLATAAIALHRFKIATGSLPVTIEELNPRFLASMQIDPMDGTPLRYKRKSENSYLLYSIGPDGEDNEGDEELPAGLEKTRTIWDGKDAIWPMMVEN